MCFLGIFVYLSALCNTVWLQTGVGGGVGVIQQLRPDFANTVWLYTTLLRYTALHFSAFVFVK